MILPTDEKVLERLSSRVDGLAQELVLTDKAIYYEGQRGDWATWINAIVLGFLSVVGLGLFYRYLRTGRLFVRHTLERVDALTIRSQPRPLIALVSVGIALLFGINAALSAIQSGTEWIPALLIGYAVATLLSLLGSALLIRFQLSTLSVNSLDGNFIFSSYCTFDQLQQLQSKVWQARGDLLKKGK
jgi:hypothetical protein